MCTQEELVQHAGGLIALDRRHRGRHRALLLAGQKGAAETMLEQLRGLFPDRLYIEVTRHHGGTVGAEEARIEA